MSLEGKKVALTGGSGGIGSRLAHELVRRRADLVVIGRIEPQDLPGRFLAADLGTAEGIDAAARIVAAEMPDILVNLAGVQFFGAVEDQESSHVLMSYLVNLVAPVRLSQAVLPEMRRRQAGQIVNIGSVLGSIHYPYFVTYSSAKAGLRGFSEGLRREVASDGIAVTHIAPRGVRTGLSKGLVERFANMSGMRLDDPEVVVTRIAEAIVRRERDVLIGAPERLFARLNALAPRLIDSALVKDAAKARLLFHR
ncbi:Short-chain dehydrogenase [Enhydrobacter aerosaccus]|uniref:Short-chain dehydrogenase n=1 Tax=Enhydrobacter aerosaccus TaxID=225324 RepID=A0A1T4R4P1_9HYPH|nr:SDR family NAD(P)-dependent oxidoreductase [Enhydrobacter aerosaccus]SKA10631.1 Short-chain dehydrogenase [Enhydrobacter aerosaccus]